MATPKALVTGGAGFIGSHVVRALLSAGHEVRVLHLPNEDLRNLDGLDVERMAGDITDSASVKKAVAGCGWVFHMAAIYVLWMADPERMRRVNVGGTRNVLRAARDAGVSRVVHTSSIAVFGGQGQGRQATETSPFRLGELGDLYALTKHESHEVAMELEKEGLDVVIVAPTGPLGPGDVGPTPTGKLLLSTVNLPVPVVIKTWNNVVDVRDCAMGHLLAAQRGRRGEAYLLGNRNLTAGELARMALKAAGVRKPIVCVPARWLSGAARAMTAYSDHVSRRAPLFTPAAVRMAELGLAASADKATRELGLPSRPVEESVRDALHWFATHGYVRSSRMRRSILARS